MLKTIIFDTDGMVVKREMYFSQRLAQEFGVPMEKILPFFKGEFQLCLSGRADLKQELKKYIDQWGWPKSIEELLEYWFSHEAEVDGNILKNVENLRSKGIKCFLSTDNEKYRVRYLLEKLNLGKFFDGVFASSELGFLKSQPEYWQAIYDKLGRPDKKEVLVWDDDQSNLPVVKNFGFQTELYTDFEAFEKRMESLIAA